MEIYKDILKVVAFIMTAVATYYSIIDKDEGTASILWNATAVLLWLCLI